MTMPITTPLNPNTPNSTTSMEIQSPDHHHDSLRSHFNRFKAWLIRRNDRAASFPPPLKQLFLHLELWKLCAIFGTTISTIASINNGLELMKVEVNLLIIGTLHLVIAHVTENMIPEVAAAALLAGVAMIIAMFHLMAFKLLDLPGGWIRRGLVISPFIACYVMVFSLVLYKICKEDVRVKEEEEIGSGDMNA